MFYFIKSVFLKIRELFFPIYRNEYKRVLPMFLMLFFICFNYSVIRNLKDTLVVTARSSGAEVIPFIKVWAMLPGAILITWIYTFLSNRYSQEKVFNIIVSAFLLFFLAFAVLFYPYREYLHPHAMADTLQEIAPNGFRGIIAMIRNWTFTLFYVISELWGSMVLSVLFWGFANQVTSVSESKRFYSIFTIGGNLAAIAAGKVSIYVTDTLPSLYAAKGDPWENILMILITVIVASGIAVLALFRWINRYSDLDSWVSQEPGEKLGKNKKKKKKFFSLKESFAYLSKSKYVLSIAVIVLSYNLVMNLVEIVWKDQLRELHPNPSDFNHYINSVTVMMGIISTVASICLGIIFRVFGWTFIALLSPIIMLVTSIGFFTFFFFQDSLKDIAFMYFGSSPLVIVVFFGAAHNYLSKAAKYSVFDATKEIAFIPLDHETKLAGKAAIDGIGSRLGKSAGSFIHQGLFVFFASIAGGTPYVAAITLFCICGWIIAVRYVGVRFNAIEKEEKEKASAESSTKLKEKELPNSKPIINASSSVTVPST